MMNWPSHLAVHEERQELFVANDADDSILVFRSTDKGNVAPVRMIRTTPASRILRALRSIPRTEKSRWRAWELTRYCFFP